MNLPRKIKRKFNKENEKGHVCKCAISLEFIFDFSHSYSAQLVHVMDNLPMKKALSCPTEEL